VVVTMGDGGLGIGGAHLLAACRRNLDLTLLILNNFNFGMTGGQFSCTTRPTPRWARILNRLSGRWTSAGWPGRRRALCRALLGYRSDVADVIRKAIEFKGFSLVDIWGICPPVLQAQPANAQGHRRSPARLAPADGTVPETSAGVRDHYRSYRHAKTDPSPQAIAPRFTPVSSERQEVIMLGSAGSASSPPAKFCAWPDCTPANVTQKNDYDITVLRGPSISEMILPPGDRLHRHRPPPW
jgi:hypothetical protein